MVLTASSVAFSIAHSNASNFTTDSSKVTQDTANDRQFLDQGELHAIAADTFDPADPHLFTVAQLIELAVWAATPDPGDAPLGLP